MGKKPSSADLASYRSVLLRLRREISGDIDELEHDAFDNDEKGSVDNPADTGSDSFAQEVSLNLLQHDEATLGEIDGALERLAQGSFGRCEVCATWITKARLTAMPHARNCVGCQRLAEKAG